MKTGSKHTTDLFFKKFMFNKHCSILMKRLKLLLKKYNRGNLNKIVEELMNLKMYASSCHKISNQTSNLTQQIMN